MSKYRCKIKGASPIIQNNGAAGLDVRSPEKREIAEIARKKGSNRTEADDLRIQELECQIAIYYGEDGSPTLPEGALRAAIEGAARKLKQGPQVREGLLVEKVESFDYDRKMGSTKEELGKSAQFTVPVKVGMARVLRTRAMFKTWSVTFIVDVDDELVDQEQLTTWLEIAGQRLGLGDWRPQKSGLYGRFEVVSVEAAK